MHHCVSRGAPRPTSRHSFVYTCVMYVQNPAVRFRLPRHGSRSRSLPVCAAIHHPPCVRVRSLQLYTNTDAPPLSHIILCWNVLLTLLYCCSGSIHCLHPDLPRFFFFLPQHKKKRNHSFLFCGSETLENQIWMPLENFVFSWCLKQGKNKKKKRKTSRALGTSTAQEVPTMCARLLRRAYN